MDERPVRLEVNGWTLASWTASPDHADALAVGRLLADGFIDGRADLHALEVEETPTGTIARARVDPARAAAARAAMEAAARLGVDSRNTSSGVGAVVDTGPAVEDPGVSLSGESSGSRLRDKQEHEQEQEQAAPSAPGFGRPAPSSTDQGRPLGASTNAEDNPPTPAAGALPPDVRARLAGHPGADRPRAPLPPLEAFGQLFRELFQSAELYQETGGLHTAALSDGRGLRHRVEEVGRHNAVDKVVGLAVLAGDDLARLGLLISARISGEMALKAARAGLAWIASRSVPTTLAVAVAETAHLPMVARAAGKEPHVYAAPSPSPPRFYPGSPLASAPLEDAEPRAGSDGVGRRSGPGPSDHGRSGGYGPRGGPEAGGHGPSGG